MKVWDQAGLKLATPGSAVRLASVARHVTDCATRPGIACHIEVDMCIKDFKNQTKGFQYTVKLV